MWVDHDSRSSYRTPGGAIQALVEMNSSREWQWKVGVLQNGSTEWSLGGAAETRQMAVSSAEAMIDIVKYSFETGGVAPCGW